MSQIPADFKVEEKFWENGIGLIAGVDEVGRGAWAGPLVAAAVVFPIKIKFPDELYDSKMLKSAQRARLSRLIYLHATSVGLGVVGVAVINRLGIGKATQKAFRAAIRELSTIPDQILIDAFYIKHLKKENQTPIKKGDQICASIAAASIVAKVYRDSIMRKLSRKYPVYGFGRNKGYGTAYHQAVLGKNNFCKIHRRSFNLSNYVQ